MTVPMSVSLMPTAPVADVVELAVLAEELGLARCWVYDEGLVTRDVYIALTAIAAQTQRIPLGPGITNPFVRHPGATAAAIATLDEFKWARMCVCSRNFGLQIDGHRTSALVPYADMLNHYRPRETKWTFDDEREAFTITT